MGWAGFSSGDLMVYRCHGHRCHVHRCHMHRCSPSCAVASPVLPQGCLVLLCGIIDRFASDIFVIKISQASPCCYASSGRGCALHCTVLYCTALYCPAVSLASALAVPLVAIPMAHPLASALAVPLVAIPMAHSLASALAVPLQCPLLLQMLCFSLGHTRCVMMA